MCVEPTREDASGLRRALGPSGWVVVTTPPYHEGLLPRELALASTPAILEAASAEPDGLLTEHGSLRDPGVSGSREGAIPEGDSAGRRIMAEVESRGGP